MHSPPPFTIYHILTTGIILALFSVSCAQISMLGLSCSRPVSNSFMVFDSRLIKVVPSLRLRGGIEFISAWLIANEGLGRTEKSLRVSAFFDPKWRTLIRKRMAVRNGLEWTEPTFFGSITYCYSPSFIRYISRNQHLVPRSVRVRMLRALALSKKRQHESEEVGANAPGRC